MTTIRIASPDLPAALTANQKLTRPAYSEGTRQAPDGRAREASAGQTEVRQPKLKGSLRDLGSLSCNWSILPSLAILVVIMRLAARAAAS
jgi:hypothetical protein